MEPVPDVPDVSTLAAKLVGYLPEHSSEPVRSVLDGALAVEVYRCARLSGGAASLTDAPTHKLTGGVQLRVLVPATRLEECLVYDARLRPGWSLVQLTQRLTTLIERARRAYAARSAREALYDRLSASERQNLEFILASAGLPDLHEMDERDVARAFTVLYSELGEKF